jgi:hypothetical protein
MKVEPPFITDIEEFTQQELLCRNSGYFRYYGVYVSYFRKADKNEIEIIFPFEILTIKTHDLIHDRDNMLKKIWAECHKIAELRHYILC